MQRFNFVDARVLEIAVEQPVQPAPPESGFRADSINRTVCVSQQLNRFLE